MQQEERDEQVQPGARSQLGELDTGDVPRAGQQARAAHGHPQTWRAEPSPPIGRPPDAGVASARRRRSLPAAPARPRPPQVGGEVPARRPPPRPAPARRTPTGWPGSRHPAGSAPCCRNATPRSTLSQVSFSQRNPEGSISIRARSIRGSSQLGDHSHRKNISDEHDQDRQQEHGDRPARPLSGREGDSGEEHDRRQREDQGRLQVVGRRERRRGTPGPRRSAARERRTPSPPGGCRGRSRRRRGRTRTCPRRTRPDGAAWRAAARPARHSSSWMIDIPAATATKNP